MDKKLFALLSGCLLSGIAEAGQTKPNVIIIYTDDHGTLDANCFGAPDLCTPNIDALATYGVRFTQFYAAPVCKFKEPSSCIGVNGAAINPVKSRLFINKIIL